MSGMYEDVHAVIAKIENEGGVVEALDYGLKAEEIPDEVLANLWYQAEILYTVLNAKIEDINNYLDEYEEP